MSGWSHAEVAHPHPVSRSMSLGPVPAQMRRLRGDGAEATVLVPQAGRTGRVAVSDVPGLDLLQDPVRPGCADEADAELERQHHEHAPVIVRAEGASDFGAVHIAVDREAG